MKKDYITFEEHIKQKHTEKIIANMLQDHCSIAKIEQWTKLHKTESSKSPRQTTFLCSSMIVRTARSVGWLP